MSGEKAKLVNEVIAGIGRTTERSMRMNQAAAGRLGINQTDMQCLQLLQQGPRTASELARLTGLTTASMTGLVDRLERAGFVTRRRDESDRRRVLIHLDSDRARKDIAPMFGPLIGSWRRALGAYTERDLAVIVEFLADVTREFDGELDR